MRFHRASGVVALRMRTLERTFHRKCMWSSLSFLPFNSMIGLFLSYFLQIVIKVHASFDMKMVFPVGFVIIATSFVRRRQVGSGDDVTIGGV